MKTTLNRQLSLNGSFPFIYNIRIIPIIFAFMLTVVTPMRIYANFVCVGLECTNISNETILAGNLINPVLGEIYTDDFLTGMAESGVLQNINSALLGGSFIQKNRVSLGYSVARTYLTGRDFYFGSTELNQLPNLGVAASPSISYSTNLGYLFNQNGDWNKWNLHIQFFSYYPSKNNLPYLNLKNAELDGNILNASLNLRYFPFASENDDDRIWKGLSFGFGIFHTNQEIILSSYDRSLTQFRLEGERRRWLGTNQAKYESTINTLTADTRYSYSLSNFSFFTGLGLMHNHGANSIRLERYASISSSSNRDDFTSNPSGLGIDIVRKESINSSGFYGIFGVELNWSDYGLAIEYLRNIDSESISLGMRYRF
ncbi:Lsa36 family surface (lipo)protein [Leptospira sp. GIMC2001]|uniref:Lsa36 family surface (lipo)protein n=1 Tax=Leptospira sp. GIMC2001 TaxID=1513297 RepID=UPI002349F71A|nr:hypothetical protein [Leptospira sp. GIMC2001]WCL49160.1 hypothetical protein O4O04_17990 [Leptospira sp. GIMC2001]